MLDAVTTTSLPEFSSYAGDPSGGRRRFVLLRGAFGTGRARVGAGFLLVIVFIALVGPYLTPHDPGSFVATPFHAPFGPAPFGADALGRDVLSRFLAGGRLILGVAVAATILGVCLGTLIGMSAAYLKGWKDDALMRANDVFLAFPMIVFALLVVSIVGANTFILTVTVAVGTAPRVARVARSAALEVVDREFIRASELYGERRWAVLIRELLPNIASPLLVEASLRLTYSIGVIAALDYLGVGVQPPNADWGLMINENQPGFSVQPWGVLLPVIAIAVLTIGTSLLADGLARALIGIERSADDGR